MLLMGEEKAMYFSKAQEETKGREAMQVSLFADQGTKWSQIMNPTGTSETTEKGVKVRGSPIRQI